MQDDERNNRTIQVDALTDVQLIDQAADADDSESEDAVGAGRAPPPLPPKRTAPRSTGRTVLLTLFAVMAGGLFAFAVVRFVSEPAPTSAPTPPSTAIAAPAEAPHVHRVQLDEELVIHAPSPRE